MQNIFNCDSWIDNKKILFMINIFWKNISVFKCTTIQREKSVLSAKITNQWAQYTFRTIHEKTPYMQK